MSIVEARPDAIGNSESERANVSPMVEEHLDLDECDFQIRNIGWTLGNACPYECKHCYSLSARQPGRNLSSEIVDRIVGQLIENGIATVNLGGNEPIFTNGSDLSATLLPYILERLGRNGVPVGITTSGITALTLARSYPRAWNLVNDLDVSLDSPFEEEHNRNRGSKLYKVALKALELAKDAGIPRTIILCAMNWNFTRRHLDGVLELADRYDAQIRFNPMKPLEPHHMDLVLSRDQYLSGFTYLMERCESIDLSENVLAALAGRPSSSGCPCGRTSFRIHSITPDGRVPISPCVYLHDYKVGDLLVDDLKDLIRTPQFQEFRRRCANPRSVEGCAGCALINTCRGGCATRSYLHTLHETGHGSLFARDPYCPRDLVPVPQLAYMPGEVEGPLVHMDYLCTWIGKPRQQ